jgi:hypothetical protein
MRNNSPDFDSLEAAGHDRAALQEKRELVRWRSVESDGEKILFSGPEPDPVRKTSTGLYRAFQRLAGKDDEGILKFAQQWRSPLSWDGRQTEVFEPFSEWRSAAGAVRALGAIAGRHDDGDVGRSCDWNLLCRRGLIPIRMTPRDINAEHRLLIGALNSWWSGLSGHRLADADGTLRCGANGLLGIIIPQVLQVLSRRDEDILCVNCKVPIPVGRKYCDRCRKEKAPNRDGMRRARAKRGLLRALVRASERVVATFTIPVPQVEDAPLRPSDCAERIRDCIQDVAHGILKDWRSGWRIAVAAQRLEGSVIREIFEAFRQHHLSSVKNLGFKEIWLVGRTDGLTLRLDQSGKR